MAEKFKQYEALMAQKRQRKAEKNKSCKGKERMLPTKLTIQRLSAQVKGTSQKYARMGPLKRVEVLEDDLCEPASIEVIRRACLAGFNLPSMSCDILESERGPSIESLDEIKNLNGTIFARFINRTSPANDSDVEDLDYQPVHNKKAKRVHSSPTKPANKPMDGNIIKSQKPVAASLSVTAMLKLGRLIQPRKEIMIRVEGFDVNTQWSPSRNVSFCVEDGQFAEGGFRKAYKCTSSDENFPGVWLLKKYNERSKTDLQLLGVDEEEHARKQTQMHMLARNIANQMSKKVENKFGETFTYNKIYFGKIQAETDSSSQEAVTIEQFIEGGPFVKYLNNTGDILCDSTSPAMQKAEALVHFSYHISKEMFILVDIQGIGYKLCDPEIASAQLTSSENGCEKINFCIGNLSTTAIDKFFEQHECNTYCKQLSLKVYVKDL